MFCKLISCSESRKSAQVKKNVKKMVILVGLHKITINLLINCEENCLIDFILID